VSFGEYGRAEDIEIVLLKGANFRLIEMQLLRNLKNCDLLLAPRRCQALTGERPLTLPGAHCPSFAFSLFGLVAHLG
jgi:hypothetical protein